MLNGKNEKKADSDAYATAVYALQMSQGLPPVLNITANSLNKQQKN